MYKSKTLLKLSVYLVCFFTFSGPSGMGLGANVQRSNSTHSRNSFVSVSDISDDEDLDLEHI